MPGLIFRFEKVFCAFVIIALLVSSAQAVVIETVPVGNPGNAADVHGAGFGRVDYEYNIGKYEVTNAQYAAFLNAVDPNGINPHGVYHGHMGEVNQYGGIAYTAGEPAGAKYAPIAGQANKPVNHVSFYNACRFANWLHNGQGNGDTETGAYTLTSAGMSANTITRNSDWRWAVPSEDEWYKAAYHKNDGVTGNYFDYPTSSDTAPAKQAPPGTDLVNGSANYGYVVNNRTDVGAYNALVNGEYVSDSPYGTFDQGGNLVEWNESIWDGTIYGSNDKHRATRGGTYYWNVNYLHADTRTSSLLATTGASSVGFRLVQHTSDGNETAVPEPMTLLAAGMSLAGLSRYLRKR